MRLLSGRASCGARAVLRALFGGAFAVLGLIAGGCGNTTYTYGTPVVTFSATPGPFTAYLVEIDSILLTRTDGATVYPLIIPQIADFTRFTDLTELYGTPALLEGTYQSATLTVNYSGAQIFANVGGANQQISTIYDGNASTTSNVAASTISYTIKFDPANPLVIKKGVSTPINFNFDLSASSVIDTSTSPWTMTVRPVLTASTQPVYSKPMRSRGLYVTTDAANNNFTINSRAFFDLATSPTGAVGIQTDANTTYNVNGITYTGAAGLTAISALPINSVIEAYGQLGDLNAVKPTFNASQVYAGLAAQNPSLFHVSGTVSARSGNTLTIHSAEVAAYSSLVSTGVAIAFYDSLPVTVSDTTLVSVDGQPSFPNPTTALISVGQKVSIEANAGTGTITTNGLDATNGLVRLQPTTAWGLAGGVQGTTLAANLISLGDVQAGAGILRFTGTGSPTGQDTDAENYQVTVPSGFDPSTLTGNPPLVRIDGLVAPFGGAPPDFTASAITAEPNNDQVLVIDWGNGGSAAPFTGTLDAGITVNMSDANVGASHTIQTGPLFIPSVYTTIDLKNPLINPKIVPDTSTTPQYAIGNASSTQYAVFHSYSSFQTQVSTVLNGTNKIQKLVAVGKWDGANFTAHRIDIVQLP